MNGIKLIAMVFSLAMLLNGCASSSYSGNAQELPTSSDQTEMQKRAAIHLQLAVGYYQQHQLPVALDEIKQTLQSYPNFAEA